MKCPVCGTPLPPLSDRCPDCGYRCRAAQPQSAQPAPTRSTVSSVPYTPPNKTRKSRGCCCALALVIPVVVFLILLVLGAVSYIAVDFDMVVPEPGFFEDEPYYDWDSESLPAAADEGCFAVADRTLMFLRDNWDGSAILRIPDTVGGETISSIGVGCFAGCEELTTILLPDSVTIISPMAFSGCTNLRGLFLPDGVDIIGRDAFALCRTLEAIRIPASVTTIAPGCFDDCAGLHYIFYGGTYEDWNALYSDYITPFTAVFCLDGDFYHGAGE